MYYGQWTKEEALERQSKGTVFSPFQVGPTWYRVRELVLGPTGAKFQAEEIPPPEEPSIQEKPTGSTAEPTEPTRSTRPIEKVVVPPGIRAWAKRKGMLPRATKGLEGHKLGPSYLSKEIRAAYREEFGDEVLQQMLVKESLDARRIYAAEGDFPAGRLYRSPSFRDVDQLTPEEIELLYKTTPRKVSEGRIKKRETLRDFVKEVTDPIVKARREQLKKGEGARLVPE